LLNGAEGTTAGELRRQCDAAFAKDPFAASAVLTALDLPAYLDKLDPKAAFPLNFPIAGDAPPAALEGKLKSATERDCAYVKVKVGRDVTAETRGAACLLKARPTDQYRFVFDANQGFSADQALTLAAALRDDPHKRLLWFEQPVSRDDWP